MAAFDALLDRHAARRRHDKLCAGTIAAAVYNASMLRTPESDALTAASIFPDLTPEPSEEEKMEQAINFFERLDALSRAEQQRVILQPTKAH